MRTLLAFFFLFSLTAFAQKESLVPDTIFVNGNIYTGTRADAPKGASDP